MFVTIDQVRQATGYTVSNDTIMRAQVVIESYVGKVESEVLDAVDQMHLGRATAFQAAYMSDNDSMVYEQIDLVSSNMYGNQMVFQPGNKTSPWIAPLAVIACNRLSWRNHRSVKTGSIFGSRRIKSIWATDTEEVADEV